MYHLLQLGDDIVVSLLQLGDYVVVSLLHLGVYAGVPASNIAIRVAKEAYAEMGICVDGDKI